MRPGHPAGRRRPGVEGELRSTVHRWAEEQKLQAEIISGIGDNRPRREAARTSPCSATR